MLLDFLSPETETVEQEKMSAVSAENDSMALELLLQGPQDPNATDIHGVTPQRQAAAKGHVQRVRWQVRRKILETKELLVGLCCLLVGHCSLLIEASVDINLATSDDSGSGVFPQMMSVKHRRFDSFVEKLSALPEQHQG